MNKFLRLILAFYFLLAIMFIIIVFFGETNYIMYDFNIYCLARTRFELNINYYRDGFVYFPSFFLIFYSNLVYWQLFLWPCFFLSIYLLIKLKMNIFEIIVFCLVIFSSIFAGNIEAFTFFIVLICCYYKEKKIVIPILLAFICFKPSLIFIVPYFLYYNKDYLRFTIIFIVSFILFNFYFLLNTGMIFEFLSYGFENKFNILDLFLRTSQLFVLYFYLKEISENK